MPNISSKSYKYRIPPLINEYIVNSGWYREGGKFQQMVGKGGYYHEYIYVENYYCLYRSKLHCKFWFQVVGGTYFGKVVVKKNKDACLTFVLETIFWELMFLDVSLNF